MMKRKTNRFLIASFSVLIAVCILILAVAFVIIAQKSDVAISEIGQLYMSAMARQTQQKFDTVLDLQISDIEGIVRRVSPESAVYGQDMIDQLALSAEVRNFTYLGLYTKDGQSETIYGEDVAYHDSKTFNAVLQDSRLRVFSGVNASGEKQLCLLIDVQYPMSNGRTSSAMVAALPMKYLEDVLEMKMEEDLMYSYIIRKDGTFVVRWEGENYFNRISEIFSEFRGKTAEEYAKELREAVNAGQEYSTMIQVDGEYRFLLCTPLPDSEWYLISVMPFGTLDNILSDLGTHRQLVILFTSAVILSGVAVIFILYYRLSQKQLAELDKAEKEAIKSNKAKSEFLSSMSHDIRTPMNGIVGMTAIAMANIDNAEKVKDCLKKITLSSKHLLGLINDVLDMSKIESGKLSLNMAQISLRETMDSIVNIVQPQIKAREQHFDIFIREIQAEEVYCDSVRLNQVLINLLSNAVKFTPEGGDIYVYLQQEASPMGENYVRCHFRVKDSGIGMTEEFQKKIFETFTREENKQVQKTEGTGLGMAITKAIVDAMGGSIAQKSAPGEGSEFHITLDLEKAEVQEQDMVLPPWKMLVVDNNEDLCLSAVSSLKEIGIDAQWAVDGESAVQMVEKHHKAHDDYEIVLLDWKMPGMDGLHTAREIRKLLGDEIPILIISAYDWSEIEEEAKEVGIHGFISKPLFKSNLFLGLSHYMMADAPGGEEQKQQDSAAGFAGKRILLAEDNDLNWEIAEDILSEIGFELERAENGKICLEKFQQSDIGFYDAILMDIRMPIMNGYDATRAIRALDRPDASLPILAMTADAFSDDIQRCKECGMNEHISKPINVDLLTQLLHKYLG